jgi:rubrerythrin
MDTKPPTGVAGANRTGVGTASRHAREMVEGAQRGTPTPSLEALELAKEIARIRYDYANNEPVGTMPPPGTLKGVAKAALDVIKSARPNVFLDKLGERLAFERSGVRLYDALIHKVQALGEIDAEPTVTQLLEIQADELRHHEIVREAIQDLGADATVETPSADVGAVATSGLVQVLTDPRTTLTQALDALLIAERIDTEGWGLLVNLADALGHSDLAQRFRNAEAQEQTHVTRVRQWHAKRIMAEATTARAVPGTAKPVDTADVDNDGSPGARTTRGPGESGTSGRKIATKPGNKSKKQGSNHGRKP